MMDMKYADYKEDLLFGRIFDRVSVLTLKSNTYVLFRCIYHFLSHCTDKEGTPVTFSEQTHCYHYADPFDI